MLFNLNISIKITTFFLCVFIVFFLISESLGKLHLCLRRIICFQLRQ